jgi:hypothetical protein
MKISAAATISFLWLAQQSVTVDGFAVVTTALPTNHIGGRRSLHALSSSSNEDDIAPANQDGTTLDNAGEELPAVQPRSSQTPSNSMSAEGYMRAMGTSPRRIVLSVLTSSGIALAGNFLGVTSNLLSAVPEETVEASGLDTYFPRGAFKRCRSNGYTFVVPKEWVADTFVELAKAQRQAQPLDYQMKRRDVGGASSTLPDSAYGPPGRLNQKGVSESGDTNVSAIVTSGLRGFSLRNTLGPPQTAAEKVLSLSIAPPGSGRVATLLDAQEDTARHVYQFEYTVDRGERGPPLRNISVVAASTLGDKLYTLTVGAPLKQWNDPVFASKLRKIATSFHLTQE